MKIITRYILKELFFFFILAFVIFSTLFMLTNVYKVINNLLGQNISTFTIIKIFMLYIPASFQLTIPMSIMIAILMSLGRLAADSEIIVLRACGVSIKQISKPVWIFAILMTIFNFYSINYLSPMSLYKARKTIQKILENTDTLTLSEKKTININTKKITIEKIDNNHLTNI
ncbi:MAG TPA: LptF/LptG family permease, partial [bacterium]|nr:LptF/LptG family permease [bacterium]